MAVTARRCGTRVHEAIATNGAGTKITMKDLTVLAPQNDPFRIDRPSAHRDGQWLCRPYGQESL
jgi:hypothetical protein